MKTENETNARNTATTSPNGPASNSSRHDGGNQPPAPEPGRPAPTNDEAAFLAQQAADAKAALTRTLSELGTGLGQSVNLAGWTRQYPWMTLGASAVAGFVASAALVPSKEDQALKKLAKIERALNPAPPKPERQADGAVADEGAHAYKTGRQSLGRTLLGEVIKAVQPALLSMLTAGVTAHAAKPSQEEMHAAVNAEEQKQAGVPPTE
jgi:hypothetical protein